MIRSRYWFQSVFASVALAFLFCSTSVSALSLSVSDDTYISANSPKSKYRDKLHLRIEDGTGYRHDDDDDDDDRHKNGNGSCTTTHSKSAYVKFDTSVLPEDLDDVDLLKSSLRVFIHRVKRAGMIHVYRLQGPWDEHSLSFDSAPPADLVPLASFTVDFADTGHFRYVDISDVVQQWIANPITNDGLVLVAENASIRVDSKENILTSHAMEIEIVLAKEGEQGEQGIQGIQGERGEQGIQGIQGERGEQGIQGVQGEQGIQGLQGIRGLTGETGPQGEVGETGPPGEKGDRGEQGLAGGSLLNVLTVALEGGDFTSIQAAIDSIPLREVPGSGGSLKEVTPTLIKIAPGEYYEQIRLRSNVRLQGAGRDLSLVHAPSDLVDCGIRTPVVCLEDVSNVEIAALGFSGLDITFNDVIDTLIDIQQSSNINIHDNRLSDVAYGVQGFGVGNIVLRNNHIPTAADAIVLSMANEPLDNFARKPLVQIISNQLDQGSVTLSGSGSVQIIGNMILGGWSNQWEGKLQVSDNQIIGNVILDAIDDSLFGNNSLLGTLVLDSPVKYAVVGNTISGNLVAGGSTAIIDNGNATIVGNVLITNSNPVVLSQGDGSFIFANSYDGNAANTSYNRLISKHAIVLESEDETVTIRAGNSEIVVDSNGDIDVTSNGDISFDTSGTFSVNADQIELVADRDTLIDAGTDLEIKSGADTNVDVGTRLDITAGVEVEINAGSTVDINAGALVDIDAPLVEVN